MIVDRLRFCPNLVIRSNLAKKLDLQKLSFIDQALPVLRGVVKLPDISRCHKTGPLRAIIEKPHQNSVHWKLNIVPA